MTYDPSGSYLALAGLVVMILGKFGVIVAANDVVGIIAALITVYGIVRQLVAHKNLAVTAGAIK